MLQKESFGDLHTNTSLTKNSVLISAKIVVSHAVHKLGVEDDVSMKI